VTSCISGIVSNHLKKLLRLPFNFLKNIDNFWYANSHFYGASPFSLLFVENSIKGKALFLTCFKFDDRVNAFDFGAA